MNERSFFLPILLIVVLSVVGCYTPINSKVAPNEEKNFVTVQPSSEPFVWIVEYHNISQMKLTAITFGKSNEIIVPLRVYNSSYKSILMHKRTPNAPLRVPEEMPFPKLKHIAPDSVAQFYIDLRHYGFIEGKIPDGWHRGSSNYFTFTLLHARSPEISFSPSIVDSLGQMFQPRPL